MTKRIVYTSGEPAGIGPQLSCFLALNYRKAADRVITVLGDIELIRERIKVYTSSVKVEPYLGQKRNRDDVLYVEHVPLCAPSKCGVLDVQNAPYVLKLLDLAHEGLMSGYYSALVTGPISKGIIAQSGIEFSGHTEYLQQKCGLDKVVMMLGCDALRVALVTTHVSIKDLPSYITYDNVAKTIEILDRDLKKKFHFANPKIYVAGLNPHAGEGGLLGTEELEIIGPAIEDLKKKGLNLAGPLPADTIFAPWILKDAAAILCMYHDQGLPVLKYCGFETGYNTTLGLPYIRTSVDHGTALDLAGSDQASGSSLNSAVKLACDMLSS